MCDPATIGAIALAGLSAGANAAAQAKVARARDDVLAAERIRQKGYDQEASTLNTASQDQYKDFGGQQDVRANELSSYFAAPTAGAANETAASVMPSAQSPAVANEAAAQQQQAAQYVGRQAASLGALRSFGELLADKSREQARNASLVGQIGGFKRGSSDITPLELEKANQAGGGLRLLGDLLGGASSIVGAGGGSGLFGKTGTASVTKPPKLGLYTGSQASSSLARALDRRSVPGYSGG